MSKLTKILLTFFLISAGFVASGSIDSFAAGQYSFTPPNGTFYVGRRFETEVKITTDQATTSADIQIKYDACKLQVEDAFGGVSGVQVFPGTAFPNYPNIGNIVTTSGCNGLIKLTGFTADSDGVLQSGGGGVFAKIRFKVLDIDLTGSIADIVTTGFGPTFTLDSNISDTNGIDMLNSATDGSFILREDTNSVPDGDDKPYFDNLSPAASGAGILRDSNIILRANDNESGVDISTFSAQISVNGSPATTYNSSSPELISSCTTSNLDTVPNCNISINPATSFPYDSQVCVSPTTRDLARKIGSLADISNTSSPLTYCFRTEFDTNKPFTTNNSPAKNSTGASTSSGLTFTLGDNETGVDIASLVVSIDGIDYPYTFTGSPNNYSITVNGLPPLNQNQTYTVRIRAKDKATQVGVSTPNQLDETYTFRTADTGKPFVDSRSPNSNGNLVNLCDSISFHLKDTGSGVDINSVRVVVSASGEYDKNRLSFSGNPNDYTITISPPTGCWPSNLPLAVGVFAKDLDGNYLDGDIWAIANGGSNIVYQTIVETIIREVPSITTVTEVQIREIIKTLPSNLTTKELVNMLSDKIGFVVDENLLQKADKNIEDKLQAIVGRSQSVALEKVNNQQSNDKKFWTWEYTGIEVNGKGSAGDTLWIELIDGNVGVQVTVDKDGNWTTRLPATLNGLKEYQVTSRPIIDGKLVGNRTNAGKITVIPWWWILICAMGVLAIAGHVRHKIIISKLTNKLKEIE
jgi:Cohesin domain